MQTITMMEFRKAPGEVVIQVTRFGKSFLVTSQGKPVFRIVPVDGNVGEQQCQPSSNS